MRVLVTGGAGFIGSHTVVSLIEAGHEAVIVDNLTNAKRSVLGRIARIAAEEPEFIEADVRDLDAMEKVLQSGFDACIHFAALKAVGESVEKPLLYYDNNVGGTFALLEALTQAGVKTFVFSSSATVYGDPDPASLPLIESTPIGAATNPYGWTKIMMEQILRDAHVSDAEWSISILRYFNPVGAHPSGLIGEDPSGVPNNLMPYVAKVAAGELARVRVFGDDYPTPDGTGVRDFVHVVDIAEGHVRALERHAGEPGVFTYNLGTGQGHSVLEVIAAYEQQSERPIPYEIVDRRAGDVAANWADVSKAARELGWEAGRRLEDMCADSWRWQQNAR
ncbi:MAG TPA: UDP-glucose 4-epimerase GalE [Acidimicrobiia bacterium]|nr:UDP-glucose 4-epimerase GalE [Acidimicrobiia bacterium]